MSVRLYLTLCACLLVSYLSHAQELKLDSQSVFSPALFSDTSWSVFSGRYSFSKYTMKIDNARGKRQAGQCHSFVCITQGKDTIYHKCFPDINALGGIAGTFSSGKARFKDYFFISKFGDYKGSLIILGRDGRIREIAGSSFFLSDDHQIVFTDQDTDIGGLTIYDLGRDTVLYDSEISSEPYELEEKYLKEIRYNAEVYYLVYAEDKYEEENGEEKLKQEIAILQMDKTTRKITKLTTDGPDLKALPRLVSHNNWIPQKGSCNCGRPDAAD